MNIPKIAVRGGVELIPVHANDAGRHHTIQERMKFLNLILNV